MTCHFPRHAAVAAADDQHFFRIGVQHHRRVSHHFLISKFIKFGQLHDAVKHQHFAEFASIVDLNVLIFALDIAQKLFYSNGVAETVVDFVDEERFFICHWVPPESYWRIATCKR